MKKPIFLSLLFFSMTKMCFSQDSCKDILENGIVNRYQATSANSIQSNVNEFFSMSQERKDQLAANSGSSFFGQGSWAGQYGLFKGLFDWSKSSQSSRESYEKITQEYQKNGKLNESSYNFVLNEIIDANVVQAWKACMISRASTFSLTSVGDPTGQFILQINYPVQNAQDASNILEITAVNYINVAPVGDNNFVKGSSVYPVSGLSQSVVRIDKTKPATVSLTIRGRSPLTINFDPAVAVETLQQTINSSMPIGTIISSMFKFEQFRGIMNDEGAWNPNKSVWSPCDGRQILSSKLHSAGGVLQVPDLRGKFMRGLNKFSDSEIQPVGNDEKDPEDRQAGSYQKDAIKVHNHTMGYGGADSFQMVENGANQRLAHFRNDKYNGGDKKVTDTAGDPETRPKNIAVYYYIKIN